MSKYDEIIIMDGYYDIVKLIKKWEITSKNMEEYPNNKDVLLPDMLWKVRKGYGKSDLLRKISAYLAERCNLMDYYGDRRYIEFYMDYCQKSEPKCLELTRLIDEIDNAAGFRDRYKGIVYIDITEWIGHEREKHFSNICDYLSDNTGDLLIIFAICINNKSESESDYVTNIMNMDSFLSARFRLEKVDISKIEPEVFLEYAKLRILEYGFHVKVSSDKILLATIKKLMESNQFDGYRTIKRLVQDIVYEAYSTENFTDSITEISIEASKYPILSKEFVMRFSKDSEYVNNIIQIEERYR